MPGGEDRDAGRKGDGRRLRLSDGRKLRFAANTVVVAGGVLAPEPAARAKRSRRRTGRRGPLVQRRCTADRRLRAGAQLLRRASDHPLVPPARRRPADLRVLVQPGRGPGPDDAGLVLGPLRKHAPLPAPELHRVVVGSQSNGRVKTVQGSWDEAHLRAERGGPEADDQGHASSPAGSTSRAARASG